MIKVPFDVEGNHVSSQRDVDLDTSALGSTLDNAYKTMPWFKYLADHATEIKVLNTYYNAPAYLTTHIVGFELEGKYETLYRLKYNDGQ